MILARLLTPEAFGIVATVTMIISFTEIFADAGFQKYLIKHDFVDFKEQSNSSNVAFWVNLFISCMFWVIIGIFRNDLAVMVGNPGMGNVLVVACLSLPLTAISSIQLALLRRNLDFKSIFFARIIGIIIPLFVTIPLAFLTHSFWALIVGTIATNLANTVLLTKMSNWRPSLYFNLPILKDMFSFSIWTLTEQLLGWLNLNIGIFIVGVYLTSYYLGVYKTSMAIVNQAMSVIISAVSPILLASLSRLKEDREQFSLFFYKFELLVGMLILPLGVGIYMYQDLATRLLLGSQWNEASGFIGLWALIRALHVVFGMFTMEVFVSIGKPQVASLSQGLNLLIILPVLLYSAPLGFEYLYITRSLVVIFTMVVELFLFWKVVQISPIKLVAIQFPALVATICMGGVAYVLQQVSDKTYWGIASIFICAISYFIILIQFPSAKQEIVNFIKRRK